MILSLYTYILSFYCAVVGSLAILRDIHELLNPEASESVEYMLFVLEV